MDKNTELELVQKAKKDIKAFNELYDFYKGKVLGYCLNRLSNKDIAQEITSEVFLSAIESIDRFDTKRGIRFGSWLFSVAHNKIIDYFRKKKPLSINDLHEKELSGEQDFSKELIQSEMQLMITTVLSTLKPRYQEIISLRYYSDLDNEEIAQILKININNVAVLIHRALQSFKKKFESCYPKTEIFDIF